MQRSSTDTVTSTISVEYSPVVSLEIHATLVGKMCISYEEHGWAFPEVLDGANIDRSPKARGL